MDESLATVSPNANAMRKMRTVNRRTFAYSRAMGLTLEDAYIAAGGMAGRGAAVGGHRIEREPAVQRMIEMVRKRHEGESELVLKGAWLKYSKRLHFLPDDPKATYFDVLKGADIVGRTQGAFIERVKIEGELEIGFRGFAIATPPTRTLEQGDAELLLPSPATPALPAGDPKRPHPWVVPVEGDYIASE